MRIRTISNLLIVAVIFFALAHPCYADAPKLGMLVSVEADGFFDPAIKKITITKVEGASLAEAAGIVSGDEVVQVEGQPVVGRRAKEVQALMKFGPGETRTLRVKHADGKEFDAKLTKPKE